MKSFMRYIETGKKKWGQGKLILRLGNYIIKCSYGRDLIAM